MSNSGIIFPGQPVLPVEKSGFGKKLAERIQLLQVLPLRIFCKRLPGRSAFPITLCSDWKAGSWI